MRIALVAPLVSAIAQPYLGGAQALLADLARGLLQRGHSITLFARDDSFVPGIDIEPVAVPGDVRPANFSKKSERAAGTSFFTQANIFLDLFLQLQHRSAEFDVIHVHAFDWPAYACSTLTRDVPVLHTLDLPALSPEMNTALHILHHQANPLALLPVSTACARS